MNLVQITPGAGGMYCGNCFRDNTMVRELRALGHTILMLPLYLPMTLDEPDESAGAPVFFGGINVYLQQQSSLFSHAPNWFRQLVSHPRLLKWAGGKAAKTHASDVGEMTLSMIRGEEGRHARELRELTTWLAAQQKTDAVCLSNGMLIGMARELKRTLTTRVVCSLQGEDQFLDDLGSPHSQQCWDEIIERAREVDRFVAPSKYYGDIMTERLKLRPGQLSVVHSGISLDGYDVESPRPQPSRPTLGFFARMCREKGLDRVVKAYLIARRKVPSLRLKIGGACGPSDLPLVEECKRDLAQAGAMQDVEFHPNLSRPDKIQFLKSLSFLSVPVRYKEDFGLYVLESMAAGTPVVQNRCCAFPELVDATGGGVMCDDTEEALAAVYVDLAQSPDAAKRLGETGKTAVQKQFSSRAMALRMSEVFERA
ncbi:MAG: glycosyltransferase family 4 protein [Verrucomicrobia bacterium]|nr:glycosyltransferase family 4 protein [Verrucomicrobiota bacterium]